MVFISLCMPELHAKGLAGVQSGETMAICDGRVRARARLRNLTFFELLNHYSFTVPVLCVPIQGGCTDSSTSDTVRSGTGCGITGVYRCFQRLHVPSPGRMRSNIWWVHRSVEDGRVPVPGRLRNLACFRGFKELHVYSPGRMRSIKRWVHRFVDV